jgi:hypothetical protein
VKDAVVLNICASLYSDPVAVCSQDRSVPDADVFPYVNVADDGCCGRHPGGIGDVGATIA